MSTPKSELPRRTSLGRMAVGALVAVGVALAAGSPAMADNWKHNGNGHGNKHWKHNNGGHNNGGHNNGGYYYQPRPKVVYVQPRRVYVQPAPVYYYQPAPVYYVQPAPVYRRPQINIVFPLDFD